MLNSDIRYIKTGKPDYINADEASLLGTSRIWSLYVIALVIFLILVIVFRRYTVANADIVGRRVRKASKAATKRLKTARKLIAAGDANAFYEETMRALWGYVGDRLNMPASELTRDNIREKLTERGATTELTDQFIAALDECEFARFAPGDATQTMDKVYAAAEDVINKMEGELKSCSVSLILKSFIRLLSQNHFMG